MSWWFLTFFYLFVVDELGEVQQVAEVMSMPSELRFAPSTVLTINLPDASLAVKIPGRLSEKAKRQLRGCDVSLDRTVKLKFYSYCCMYR